MTEIAHRAATLDDLHSADGRFELVGGRLVELPMPGRIGAMIGERIYRSLYAHIGAAGPGEAHADGLDYAVPVLPSGRESFRPDASYYAGALPESDWEFIPGPPTFAAEVRSKKDYGPAAEATLEAKRADYFRAGTLVVWDVDPAERVVVSYRHDDRRRPRVFRLGEVADAEPAVPGWRMAVDDVFGSSRG